MFKNITFFNSKTKTLVHTQQTDFLLFFTKTQCFSTFSLYLIDVSYTGKTYKWSVKPNFWKLVFNRVHPNLLFFKKKIILKKMAKTKFRVLLQSQIVKTNLLNIFYTTRRYNIFTHRGLKIKGQLFFKKRGKVSTYR